MAPRTRRRDAAAAVPELADAVLAQWQKIVDVVAVLPDDALAAPSVLPGWTTADLVMHVARSATAVTEALAEVLPGTAPAAARLPAGPAGRPVPATDYLSGTGVRAEEVAGTARRLATAVGEAEARPRLAAEVATARAALARLAGPGPLPGPGPGPDLEISTDPLVMTPGGPMVMTEFLRTRAVEAVVHGLDLGVEPERPALRLATRLVAELFAARVPGHAVELRVPPFAAVQIVAGPRHTRGTPPNVVEAGPVPFLLVCAGRLAWAEAVADGRITASGERADLSEHLPLL
ncbi:sterol carrier family protein [Frankia sp. AgB32]|uniref:sterol carrier family protein n=1 Tax=Frankia sp. AgB32 TaxID=631119 RepID=UPI002010B91D|nr:sterol carrier family protein [Frankia sp. AgB32]MCK9895103.1 sterol carrier family protein [Frankia sp. AgB32]